MLKNLVGNNRKLKLRRYLKTFSKISNVRIPSVRITMFNRPDLN